MATRKYQNFPCLIDENNPAMEALDDHNIYDKLAKNLFKHLTYGQATNSDESKRSVNESPLYHEIVVNHFTKERDPKFAQSICAQLQQLFENAFQKLQYNPDLDFAVQYEIFQKQILSSYPFWDPDTNQNVRIPQLIEGSWQMVEFKWNKFDISPEYSALNPLTWVMKDEDRMYAYALESVNNSNAKNYLLFMGTTYPSGQGSELASMENFRPGCSVGEGHELKQVHEWLDTQDEKSVIVTGHSKGATMAMIVAAKYPKQIMEANSLNPAALSRTTLSNLSPEWNKLKLNERPSINVYAQEKDPVFPLEQGFLGGTNIYKVRSPQADEKAAMNFNIPVLGFEIGIPSFIRTSYEAHIHIFSGRKEISITKISTEEENNSLLRAYFNDTKAVYNYFKYTQMYINTFCCFLNRNLFESLDQHIKSSKGILPLFGLTVIDILLNVVSFAAQLIGIFFNLAMSLAAVVVAPIVGGAVFAANQMAFGISNLLQCSSEPEERKTLNSL